MKKFYLSALGCLLAMGASAQKIEQVGTMQGDFWELQSIPTEYAYGGKSSVYTINAAESGVEFIVYNKSFAVDRTIKLVDPISYRRIEVEKREAGISSFEIGEFDCGYKTLDEFSDGYTYTIFYETKSYPHWWAVNKCTNTTYTDEYVDEFIESQGRDLIEKKVYDGGTLFYYFGSNWGYYFKNNKLLEAMYDTDSEKLIVCEDCEIEEYYDFYNTQLAVFSQEDITEYINMGQTLSIRGNWFSHYHVDSIATEKNGKVVFYTNYYYEEDIFGKQYPMIKFVWDKGSNTLTAIYEGHMELYIGEWQKSLKDDDYYEESNWLRDIGIYPLCVGGMSSSGTIYATQTFFNNDEKWEYLRPAYEGVIDPRNGYTYEQDRDMDGEIDYRQTRYTDKLKGYEVVSEDGDVLSTIPVPEGDSYELFTLQWDGETYFGISVMAKIEEDGDYYYEEFMNLYSIDKIASNVQKIASTPVMRVSPTIANRNSTVNVTLGAETVENGGELIITDSNGRTIGRSYVEAGQTSVPVTTDRMSSGVYNITLTEKGQKVENARIIVK